jgi:hypothetical protein
MSDMTAVFPHYFYDFWPLLEQTNSSPVHKSIIETPFLSKFIIGILQYYENWKHPNRLAQSNF